MTARRTSADWDAEADALRKKLDNARREARKLRKLEELKEAEIQRQEEIRYALKFTEFSKSIILNNTGITAFNMIAGKLEEAKSSGKDCRAGFGASYETPNPVSPNQNLQ